MMVSAIRYNDNSNRIRTLDQYYLYEQAMEAAKKYFEKRSTYTKGTTRNFRELTNTF